MWTYLVTEVDFEIYFKTVARFVLQDFNYLNNMFFSLNH